MPRPAPAIRAEIAETKARLRALRLELRSGYPGLQRKIVTLRQAGEGLDEIASALSVPRSIVVNNLYRARVRRPGRRLWEFSDEQQKLYRKCRRSGVSAEDARAAAGMTDSGALPTPAHSPARHDALSASTPAACSHAPPSGRDLEPT